MTRHRFTHRRGISLVEIMATMTILTVVLGLTVALLEMLLKLNASGREHAALEASIARLGRAFRHDVRDSDVVSRCDDGGSSLALALRTSGREPVVEYHVRKSGVLRVEWNGSEIVKQETYPLPSRSSPRFARRSATGRQLVGLVLDRRARKADAGAVHAMSIEATVGASRRFDTSRETQP